MVSIEKWKIMSRIITNEILTEMTRFRENSQKIIFNMDCKKYEHASKNFQIAKSGKTSSKKKSRKPDGNLVSDRRTDRPR